MADHIWTVLCSKSITESESKVVSLIEVVEKISVAGQGNVAELVEQAKRQGNKGIQFEVRMQLVTWWIRSDAAVPETVPLRIAFVDPDGERLYQQPFEVNLAEGANSRRTVIRFDHLWMTGFGRYWFVVEQQKPSKGRNPRWVAAARIPLEIEQERLAEP